MNSQSPHDSFGHLAWVGLLIALWAWWSNNSVDAAHFLLLAALLVFGSLGILVMTGSELFGVSVHHKPALIIMPPLMLLQVPLAYNILGQRWLGNRALTRLDMALPLPAIVLVGITIAIPAFLARCLVAFLGCIISLRMVPTLFRLFASIVVGLPIVVVMAASFSQ